MQSNRYNTEIVKLGERVKQIRTQKGISQFDLEAASGIDRGNISKIENGKMDIHFSSIVKLAEGLEVELWELFEKGK